jgi:RNA polymerase sigma factor (TIGR02999 family)
MSAPARGEVTGLLQAWNAGDRSALEKLAPMVHAELHRLARHYMAGERKGHILQTTALINEAYTRLIDWKNVKWQNRAHFYGVAAGLMRRILVDFARCRPRLGPDTEVRHVPLEGSCELSPEPGIGLVQLDDALKALAAMDDRKGRIVELRFFGGLTVDETAEVLQVSRITVIREWNKARAWLYRELDRTVRSQS